MVLDSELPHLIGIDDDLLSTGIILYHLKVRAPRNQRKHSAVSSLFIFHISSEILSLTASCKNGFQKADINFKTVYTIVFST